MLFYSTHDSSATICPKSIQYSKGYTVITIDFNGQKYTYRINSISDGMVENL